MPLAACMMTRAHRACESVRVSYLTDGVHLYENLGWRRNFGLTGGGWLDVRDCVTDTVRRMCELELALCEPVSSQPTLAR